MLGVSFTDTAAQVTYKEPLTHAPLSNPSKTPWFTGLDLGELFLGLC